MIDGSEEDAGFRCLALLLPQAGQARRRAQFPGFGFLLARNIKGFLKALFRF